MIKKAYTLIEILIVIAIIAVITGIAFASFGPARESARKTVCLSNMHQIGVGYSLYMQDYNGVELQEGVKISAAQAAIPIVPTYVTTFVDKYIGSRAVMHCPSYHDPAKTTEKLFSTYAIRYYNPVYDTPTQTENQTDELSKRGMDSWLAICDQHNVRVGAAIQEQHTWEKRWINMLRFNQQLSKIQIPVKQGYTGL